MENNKTQSAVEWLEEQIQQRIVKRNPHDTIVIQTQGEILIELFEKAKVIEEQRIKQELEKLKDFEVWKEWKNSNDL